MFLGISYGSWFVVTGFFLYLGAAIFYAIQKQWPWVWIYCCYAGANIGLVWAAEVVIRGVK